MAHQIVRDQNDNTLRVHEITDVPATTTELESGPVDIVFVTFDNSAESTPDVGYLKFWDKLKPTVGTDHPDMMLPCHFDASFTALFYDKDKKVGQKKVWLNGLTIIATKTKSNDAAQVALDNLPTAKIGVRTAS